MSTPYQTAIATRDKLDASTKETLNLYLQTRHFNATTIRGDGIHSDDCAMRFQAEGMLSEIEAMLKKVNKT